MSSRVDKPRSPPGRQKRALSGARRSGRLRKGGDRQLAAALGNALQVAQRDEVVLDSLTHPLHTYPARMHPATARALVDMCFDFERVTPRRVLDPFCGSGTTLVEVRAAGIDAIGCDLNPLAVRIAHAKTWGAKRGRRLDLKRLGHEIANATIAEGKAARRADYEPRPLRKPKGIDPELREQEIAEWFAPHVRRELEFIAGAIEEAMDRDAELAGILQVCLSAILVKCSKRRSDTSSKVMVRHVARGAPARWFRDRVDLLCAGLDDLERGPRATVEVHELDARRLGRLRLAKASVGAVISSPPYVGTYDYVEHHRLRLAFLGLPFESFERGEIGARRRFRGRGGSSRALDGVRNDFAECMKSWAEVVAPGGLVALLVGDSVAGGEAVWADELVASVHGDAFENIAWAWQERQKLGGFEKRAFGDDPKREHLILLRRR